MDLGQWLVIGLCAFLIVWYVLGWLYNRHRGQPVLAWMQAGLDTIGKPGDLRWLSPLHSSAQVIVADAHSPFRKLGSVFVLEPRENFPVWIFRHALGRRDELYIRADLRSMPNPEIEVKRKGGPAGAALRKAGKGDPFTSLPGTETFDISRRGKTDDQAFERLMPFLTRYENALLDLSLQRFSPHLILRLRLVPLMAEPYAEFLAALGTALK